jgi:hypothetical protein
LHHVLRHYVFVDVVHPHPKMVLSAIALGGRGDFPPLSLLGDLGKG